MIGIQSIYVFIYIYISCIFCVVGIARNFLKQSCLTVEIGL